MHPGIIWFQPNLSVVPVHVELVSVKDVGRLVDVLDGQPDRRHDPAPDLALGGAGGHGEKRGKINVSSETKTNVIYYSWLRISFRTVIGCKNEGYISCHPNAAVIL